MPTSLRKPQTWIWSVLGLALVVRTAVRDRGVIYDHLEFGRRLFSGETLYAPYLDDGPLHPVYPPSFGLLTAPFTLVPDPVARALWAVLQVVALAWIGVFLARELERRRPDLTPHVHWILAATAVLGSRYILRDTHGGGGNLINLALVLAAVAAARARRVGWSCFALGLSLATKPTMVLCVPLLWILGFPAAALGSVLVAAGLLGTSLLVHGDGLEPLRIWIDGSLAYGSARDLFAPPDAGFPPFTWMNQCLRCAVVRYFGTVPAEFADEVPGFVPGLGLSDTVTLWIRHAASLCVLAVTARVAWRDRARPDRLVPILGAFFAASLLLSPISWKAHHVALMPALFLLGVGLAAKSRAAWVIAVGYFVACVLGEEVVGKDFKNVQQSLYLTTAGTFVVWGLCLGGGGSAWRADDARTVNEGGGAP